MEWYPKVLQLVNSAFPTLRKTRKRNLTLLTHAILKRRTLCQAELARAFPGKTTHHHKKKRLHRFTSNEALRPLTSATQLIPKVCQRFGFHTGRIPLSLDWTPLRAGEQALFAALPIEGRGLPLLFWATSFAQIRQGSSQNDLEEAFVRRLIAALPQGVWPVLLADRGFGRVSFLLFLLGLVRGLGRWVSFVIRLPGKVAVEHGGARRLLRDWPLAPGQLIFLEGASLRQDRAVSVKLVLWWEEGQKEPWYLATDLDDPFEAIRLYERRAWIEEMFRDFKHRLGLEKSRVAGLTRLERLMLGLVLAYLVLAMVGLFAGNSRFVAGVISWGRASFLFLALAYYEAHGPPHGILQWKGVS